MNNIFTFRGGHPSGSNFYRYKNCPGSFLLSQDMESKSTAYSVSGDRLHGFLYAGDKCAFKPTLEEAETLETIKKLESECISQTVGASAMCQRERRMWLLENGSPIYSAQLDVIHYGGDHNSYLVIDYKTGHEPVETADANMQIMSQVVLVWDKICDKFWLRAKELTVYGAIIGPWQEPRISTVAYSYSDYKAARNECIAIVEALFDEHAPIRCGDWCKYCPAKLICPALKQSLTVAETLPSAKTISNEDLNAACIKFPVIRGLIKDLESEAKKRLVKDPNCLPGLWLKPGGERREISDINQCYEIAMKNGITYKAFLGCVDLSVEPLEKLYKTATGLKCVAAKDGFNREFSSVITKKQNQPSLEVI